jgi:uncharacterized membrane protein
VGLVILGLRVSGVTSLGPWGIAALFAGLVSGVAGVSIFALGATSNYLVSLFYKRPIRQGLFGRPIFKEPLDRKFGWMGLLTIAIGVVVCLASLILGLNGWVIARLWLYLTGGAMLVVVGIQLVLSWVLSRVLEELSQQESQTRSESKQAA